jgi:dTDP-4-dehydrorhamnose 3,5-epimerase
MIDGVCFKDLVTHADDRGFFRELIRCSDDFFAEGFGQLSHAVVFAGIVKAWHAHAVQYQWNYVVNGLFRVLLYDTRPDSQTFREKMEFLAGDYQAVRIYKFPPRIAHGYKCINGPANILYVTSGVYDAADEIRIRHDDESFGVDWFKPEVR